MNIDPSQEPESPIPTAEPDVFEVDENGERTPVESPSIFDEPAK